MPYILVEYSEKTSILVEQKDNDINVGKAKLKLDVVGPVDNRP